MPEYYWKKRVLNVRILNVSMQCKVTVQIAEQLSRQMYSEHCQTFKMERVAKRAMLEWRCAARILSGQGGGFVKLGHVNKLFIKNPQWNILKIFLLDTLKTTFWMTDLTQRWTQSGSFYPKKAGEVYPLLRNCAPVSVAAYASISLNIPKYPWKCLSKLFWLCQGSKCAWSSYVFDRLLKMPCVVIKRQPLRTR